MASRKGNLLSYKTITNGDMSLSSLTSKVTNIQYSDNIGIQLNFTGSPVGTFAIQISADYAQDNNGNVTNAGNWVAITLTPAPIASGAGNNIYVDITQISAPWMRIVYTKTSGTGSLNAFITSKRV